MSDFPGGPQQAFDPGVPSSSGEADEACPFCTIASAYALYAPTRPPTADASSISPWRVTPAAFVVLSTETLVAFLDIMPLSRGHVLLCPRAHRGRLTETTAAEAAELGAHLRLLSRALVRAVGVPDWNVVQNNGAAAAQVVDHVHYHLIPRPELRAEPSPLRRSFTMFGRGVREELDDDEAARLAVRLRECLAEVLLEEQQQQQRQHQQQKGAIKEKL